MDIECPCQDFNFMKTLLTCVRDACTPPEYQRVVSFMESFCTAVGATPDIPEAPSSSAPPLLYINRPSKPLVKRSSSRLLGGEIAAVVVATVIPILLLCAYLWYRDRKREKLKEANAANEHGTDPLSP
ncbi:hypothetical protein H072_2418 [Dactylellina haptotyla CBS 200.50]|uniref:CFEM domain-containing protein n=1 Tax=Dactylellina haptotyla (strain CBS 200.50) TaxID=1284197 RepID=S8AL78_DACHA|nr:hypothetical protein H072_2418 [Dactylellina haptotyla CBS 200.50]